jgi:hypothetical protein
LPDLPVIFTLGLPDRPPRIDHQQQCAGVLAFTVGFAMRDQNIAGQPDEVVTMVGNIGDDSAGLG